MRDAHQRKCIPSVLNLVVAVIITILYISCDSDAKNDNRQTAADASFDGDSNDTSETMLTVIEVTDKNNYSFESALSIPSVETASAQDVQICWDGLDKDIQCHEMDPLNDIDNVSLVRFRNLSKKEIEDSLSSAALSQSNVDGYLGLNTSNEMTCAYLSELTLFETEVDITSEYIVSEEREYMLLFSTGTVPGVGARMMTFITPSETSTNTEVVVSSGCGALDFDVDLSSLTPLPVAANGPYKIDWSALTQNGQGGELELATIDRVMLGFYAGETAASLEEKFLDLELIATSIWTIDHSGGNVADLSEATNEDGMFSGFEGNGTWVLALMNTQGQNPAPLFLTILEPYGEGDINTDDKDDSSQNRSDAHENDPSIISYIKAELSEEIATVITVQWTTTKPTAGYIAYGPPGELMFQTPMGREAATEHEALLLGLTADTEYDFKVIVSDEDGEHESARRTITTGSLPVDLPVLNAEGKGHDLFTVVPILGAVTAVTILNSQGDIVWYHIDNRDLDIYRARLSKDGTSLLYNAASVSGDPADDSEIVRVSLDGKSITHIPVPLLAHEFVEHDDGTFGAIATEYGEFNGEELRGDKIIEVAPDGTMKTIWTTWDCFDPAKDVGDDMEHGWAFANALDFDAHENVYYLGMRNFSSIAKIDRDSGICLWVLGSTAETISFVNGTSPFLHQHQFQVLGDNILVFDNDGSPGTESRVVQYELDFSSGEANEVWSYYTTPSLFTFVLGEPTRLDNGDTFINWSAAGQMERVDSEGNSIWRINSTLGYAFGYNTLVSSLYSE